MHCAGCGENTPETPCEHCGEDPMLDGRWRLVEVLGRGGAGVTWRGEEDGGDQVCVKELPLGAGSDAKQVELARREARVLQQLDHPQVPDYVAEVERGKGRSHSLFIVMELVDGVDLATEAQQRRYTEEDVLGILEELCPVLSYLHGLHPPVVHRDIKPANVRRRPSGQLVLVDFGAVRDALKDRHLGGDTIAGTFGFMAPEQFAGNATERTDLFGLGALAVALLTRQDPATLQGHDQRLRWREHAEVSGPMGRLIDDLLARNPAKRPSSAADVLRRIDEVRDPPPPPENLLRTAFHAGVTAFAMSVTAGVVGVFLLIGTVVYVVTREPEVPPARPVPEAPKPAPAPEPVPRTQPHGPKHPVEFVWRGKRGKRLFIDGRFAGRLPTTAKLSSGTYELTVKDGPIEHSFTTSITSSSNRIERVDLSAL